MKTLHIVHTDGQVRTVKVTGWEAPGRLLIVTTSNYETIYYPLSAIKYFREEYAREEKS